METHTLEVDELNNPLFNTRFFNMLSFMEIFTLIFLGCVESANFDPVCLIVPKAVILCFVITGIPGCRNNIG